MEQTGGDCGHLTCSVSCLGTAKDDEMVSFLQNGTLSWIGYLTCTSIRNNKLTINYNNLSLKTIQTPENQLIRTSKAKDNILTPKFRAKSCTQLQVLLYNFNLTAKYNTIELEYTDGYIGSPNNR